MSLKVGRVAEGIFEEDKASDAANRVGHEEIGEFSFGKISLFGEEGDDWSDCGVTKTNCKVGKGVNEYVDLVVWLVVFHL